MSDESSMAGVVVHLDRAGKAECGAKDATHFVMWPDRDSVDCWRCLQRMNKQIESAYAARREAESAKGLAAEAEREAAEWRRLHGLNAQARGRLAAAVLLAIGKAEALAHGPMSDDAVAAAVKDAVDAARGRGRFEADATAAVDDDVDVMSRAVGVLNRRMGELRALDNLRAELRAMKGE